MLNVSNYKALLISGLFLLSVTASQAAMSQYLAARIYTIPGTPIVTGANTTAQIPLPYIDPSFKDVSVTDKITFAVDHFNMTYLPTPGDIVVTLKLEQWDKNAVLTTSFPVLTLKYQPFNAASPYVDKSVYKFNGAYKFKITLQAITVGGTSTSTLPANLFIDADILLERYTNFATATTPIGILPTVATDIRDLDCNSVNDEFQINWPVISGVEEYQLEWTFVNDYSTTSGAPYIDINVLPYLEYNFKNNSTRITTANNTYIISLTFEHGYILYRVRGIGRNLTDPTKNIVGVWSTYNAGNSNDKGYVKDITSKYYNTQEHESNKNWQYSATYAEEGKKKEVISYFDGSLRNRQSVTKVNTQNNTIVGETIYDHQGRPAINVLPVPVKNPACGSGLSIPALRFYPSFNRVDATNAYSRINFDLDKTGVDTCNPVTTGMNVISGASNYYSSSNPDKTGAQAFVPDAELYPFSQIEYTPDNTGRIRRQGGVGKAFQLDQPHATKYYYGWPAQIQLDRLFGSEVGNAAHYKKNMVVDANGQVSLSYLDQEGRTVATSLAGDAPKDAVTPAITILE
ncbi:MAG: hypothetical protein H0W84_12640, partial [Bacteroidetes bacterium]|nr:hypothetical protein [Bacteroidota bacterium]